MSMLLRNRYDRNRSQYGFLLDYSPSKRSDTFTNVHDRLLLSEGRDMITKRRFAGPLASAWPAVDVSTLRELLVAPEQALPVSPAADRRVWTAENMHPETLQGLRER